MHRLLIALLSAFDALIAAAVGLAVSLAALTLLWVLGIGAPDWNALWPATAAVWQLGNLVPFTISLPAEYLAAAGIPDPAANFALSLAPLAFACFSAYRGVRSGVRAGRSGAWLTGVVGGTAAFAVVAAAVALTSHTPVATASTWQAILLPTLVFFLPCLAGALGAAWRTDAGAVGRLRELIGDLPGLWPEVPALALRGAAVALAALAGIGAVGVIAALILRGDEVIALYQAANLDVWGVIVVSLAQLAYLPTLVVWAVAFAAGPGIAVGAGSAVSPAGTQVGVLPGIPLLGALPETVSPWLLLVVLLPIGAGVAAGWMMRERMLPLTGPGSAAAYAERAAAAAAVAAVTAGGAALAAGVASGAFGPGRLAQLGPNPGAVALAVGLEVLVGAGILLLTPAAESATAPFARWGRSETPEDVDEAPGDVDAAPGDADAAPADPDIERAGSGPAHAGGDETQATSADEDGTDEDDIATAPIDPGFLDGPDEIRP